MAVFMVQKTSRKRTLQLAAPPVLVEAVKDAADRELLTISEYIRRTLIARLQADGVHLAKYSPSLGTRRDFP
jgi:hypothetical protein